MALTLDSCKKIDTTLYLEKIGTCKINIKFEKPLAEAYSFIVFAEFQKLIAIDKQQTITLH